MPKVCLPPAAEPCKQIGPICIGLPVKWISAGEETEPCHPRELRHRPTSVLLVLRKRELRKGYALNAQAMSSV
jgi:hypothetical protein